MVISANTQLGLRFNDSDVQVSFLQEIMLVNKHLLDGYQMISDAMKKGHVNKEGYLDLDAIALDKVQVEAIKHQSEKEDNGIARYKNEIEVNDKINALVGEINIVECSDSKYFLICDSVYRCAELIKIGDGFTGRTVKDINLGKYTYLMGKHQMVRFVCVRGAIKGFYYDDLNKITFEWGIDIEDGGYYFDFNRQAEFSTVMQILAFVELGDIEIVELKGGRNNGGAKNKDKITNTTKNTVFVVDSTWNKIIIRTDGFAVRGHFRLQPCGTNMADRKLLWINAFEKHGYKRLPKASIARD